MLQSSGRAYEGRDASGVSGSDLVFPGRSGVCRLVHGLVATTSS